MKVFTSDNMAQYSKKLIEVLRGDHPDLGGVHYDHRNSAHEEIGGNGSEDRRRSGSRAGESPNLRRRKP